MTLMVPTPGDPFAIPSDRAAAIATRKQKFLAVYQATPTLTAALEIAAEIDVYTNNNIGFKFCSKPRRISNNCFKWRKFTTRIN